MTKETKFTPELARLRGQFIAVVEAYSAHRGTPATNSIRNVLGNNKGTAFNVYIPGADFHAGRYDNWVQEFSNAWPDGLEWPAGTPRPPVTEAANG